MAFLMRVRKILVLDHWVNKGPMDALHKKINLFENNWSRRFFAVLEVIRPQHWVKNLLVMLPLLVGNHYHSMEALRKNGLGFIVFCLLAASAYVINDWIDKEDDKQHPHKNKRPFAAGRLSRQAAYLLAPFFFFLAFAAMCFLPIAFCVVSITYFLTTFYYSLHLKKKKWLDVFILTFLYLLRIVAGMTLVESGYSFWLLFLAFFLFISLALVKRYAELCRVKMMGTLTILGRAYCWQDSNKVFVFGHLSAYAAVLTFVFYIFSQKVALFYLHPFLLLPVAPLLLVWVGRLWYLAAQGKIKDDPVSFTVQDPFSWLIAVSALFIVGMAKLY